MAKKGQTKVAQAPQKLKLLITIVNREKADFYMDLLQTFEVNMQFATNAEGTASSDILQMMGLAQSEKAIVFSIIREDRVKAALEALEERFASVKGGKGIASSIGVFMVCSCAFELAWIVVFIMSLVAALLFIYFTEFGAMGSFIAITPNAIGCGIRLFLLYHGSTDSKLLTFYIVSNMLILAICFFTWFAHRKNIERMLSG